MTKRPAEGGRWLYPLFLSIQALGIAIVYWKGLPLYRAIIADPSTYRPPAESWKWALPAVAFSQTAYWLSYRIDPPKPQFVSAALGHLVSFVARLSFVLPSAAFSFVFIAGRLEQLPFSRAALLVIGLFTCFCFMLEMQRFGTHLTRQEKAMNARPDRN